jgi:hypothetical protein
MQKNENGKDNNNSNINCSNDREVRSIYFDLCGPSRTEKKYHHGADNH